MLYLFGSYQSITLQRPSPKHANLDSRSFVCRGPGGGMEARGPRYLAVGAKQWAHRYIGQRPHVRYRSVRCRPKCHNQTPQACIIFYQINYVCCKTEYISYSAIYFSLN